MTAPLDLRAVDERLRHHPQALLAHCRALRAALQAMLAVMPTSGQEDVAWAHAAAVLAAARDGPA